MNRHHGLALAAIVLAGAATAIDATVPARVGRPAGEAGGAGEITAVELAERIRSGPRPQVFDLRGPEEFAAFHVPGATQARVEALLPASVPPDSPIVLYAEGRAPAEEALALLRRRGYRNVRFLRGGIYEWLVRIHEPRLATDATPAERAEFEGLAALSRYFGGQPHVDVPRAEVPQDDWRVSARNEVPAASVKTSLLVAAIRRRGC